MITISLCMIVKNEEETLPTCLNSLKDLMDEMIIVDTGSTDRTKEIAASYGAQVFDFKWIDDFSAARNYAFSKATCEYIYSADADEDLDEENIALFQKLKERLDPEVEIVQMYYTNQLAQSTVYNFDRELRAKLFKRLRPFVWIDPIHEMVRLDPVVYDSDIEIIHRPRNDHGSRDLQTFKKALATMSGFSKRLHNMYARELTMAGTKEDILGAEEYFTETMTNANRSIEEVKEAACIVTRAARLRGDVPKMMKAAMKCVASDGCAEVCYELGLYYMEERDYDEAIVWFYNAAYMTEAILDLHTATDLPRIGLAACYKALGMPAEAAVYEQEAAEILEKV